MEACSCSRQAFRQALMGVPAAAPRYSGLQRVRPPCSRAPLSPRLTLHRAKIRSTVACRSSGGSKSNSGRGGSMHGGMDGDMQPGDEDEHLTPEEVVVALGEAAEVYVQASDMARLQVSSELEAQFAGAGVDGSTDASSAPSSQDQLVLFWVEQGLPEGQASRLVAQLEREQYEIDEQRASSSSNSSSSSSSGGGGDRGTYLLSTNQLATKLGRLQRILPGVDVPALVAGEPPLLRVSIDSALHNMIALVEGLPGHDVVEIVTRIPRLLWIDDVRGRVRKVFSKLMSLHPSQDERVVADIVGENPSLIWRIPDYYMHAMLIDDFPIEIQNMMVLSDNGIGFLYKYYKMQQKDEPQQGWDRGGGRTSL